jgi:hypothetical protein
MAEKEMAKGYLWNATIYCGRNDVDDAQNKQLSATHALVLQLLQPLAGKHHIVHMDNYFLSIPLFNDLASLEKSGAVEPSGQIDVVYVKML